MPHWLPTDYWQLLAKRIRSQVGGLALYRVGVDGDGACFFHSLAALMNTENYRNANLRTRKEIVKRMREKMSAGVASRSNDTRVADEIAEYSRYADESIIREIQNSYKINVIFWCLDSNEVQAQVPVLDVEKYPTVMIAWVEHEHFEPIFACIGCHQGYRVLQGVFDPTDPNVPVLKTIEEKIHRKAAEFADDDRGSPPDSHPEHGFVVEGFGEVVEK